MDNSAMIIEKYFIYCESSFVERHGTVVCGVLPALTLYEDYPYQAKPETTAEHMGRATFLTGLIMMYYPGIVPEEKKFDYLMQQLTHDVGEYKNGDMLDDGSILHSQAVQKAKDEEGALMEDFYKDLPDGQKFIEMMENFENYQGEELFLKLIEKLDAVLFQMFLYTKHICGDVRKKRPKASKRDLRFAGIIESFRAVDVWAFHLRLLARDYAYNFGHWLVLERILTAGFLRIYRDVPKCMLADLTGVPIDDPSDSAS